MIAREEFALKAFKECNSAWSVKKKNARINTCNSVKELHP